MLSAALLLACSRAGASANSAHAQLVRLPVTEGGGLRFVHVSFGEGPSRSNIRQIIQDDQGFLWFGTQDGLKRYDGYQFREYRYQEGTPNDLSGTSVTALFKDRAGFVWVGSDRYLDRYDPRTERFTAYASDAHGSGIFDGGVNQITQDADGAIWLSTTEELCRLDLPTGRGVRYHHRAGDSASLSSSHVKSTLRGK